MPRVQGSFPPSWPPGSQRRRSRPNHAPFLPDGATHARVCGDMGSPDVCRIHKPGYYICACCASWRAECTYIRVYARFFVEFRDKLVRQLFCTTLERNCEQPNPEGTSSETDFCNKTGEI